MHALRVVYVDDEALALENFKMTMQDCAAFGQVSLFLSASEALAHAAHSPIDLAFLDIDLPHTDGFALCAQLKALHPQLAVAFITGNVRYMSESNQIVPAPYIFKPYRKEDILAALSGILPAVFCG